MLPEDEDEAIIADALLLGRQRLRRLQLLQHIVHLREGDVRMSRLHLLAVRIELLARCWLCGRG